MDGVKCSSIHHLWTIWSLNSATLSWSFMKRYTSHNRALFCLLFLVPSEGTDFPFMQPIYWIILSLCWLFRQDQARSVIQKWSCLILLGNLESEMTVPDCGEMHVLIASPLVLVIVEVLRMELLYWAVKICGEVEVTHWGVHTIIKQQNGHFWKSWNAWKEPPKSSNWHGINCSGGDEQSVSSWYHCHFSICSTSFWWGYKCPTSGLFLGLKLPIPYCILTLFHLLVHFHKAFYKIQRICTVVTGLYIICYRMQDCLWSKFVAESSMSYMCISWEYCI